MGPIRWGDVEGWLTHEKGPSDTVRRALFIG
ncbi:MAG: hypothetical protein JWR77_2099 [Rhizorhabdus sp.]|nr:hypothetical protein [Rhizorhabdus sp.]